MVLFLSAMYVSICVCAKTCHLLCDYLVVDYPLISLYKNKSIIKLHLDIT